MKATGRSVMRPIKKRHSSVKPGDPAAVELDCGHLSMSPSPSATEAQCPLCTLNDWAKGPKKPPHRAPPTPSPQELRQKKEDEEADYLMWQTAVFLKLAVPLWLAKWKAEHRSADEIRREGLANADLIAERSDLLIRGAKGAGDVFNAIAKAMVALSFCPGGVDFLGCHFETNTDTLEEISR